MNPQINQRTSARPLLISEPGTCPGNAATTDPARLGEVDFTKVASGFGLESVMVDDRKGLDEAIDKMLAFDGPYLLEVKVEKEENIFPMIPSGAAVTEMRLE